MRAFLAGTLRFGALAVAGCGGGSSPTGGPPVNGNGEAAKSGKQVIADAVKAAKAATSFHMSGQITTTGQQIGLDLTIAKGKGAMGSITLGGQKVDLLIIGSDGYMKASAAFWTQFAGSAGGAIAHLVGGKWVKFPTTNAQFGPIAGFANSNIFDSVASSDGTITNKGATTYKGQGVVKLFNAKNGTAYVAATGTAYPVAFVGTGTGVGGAITFDSWNNSVTLTAPSGAIDFSKLGSGG